MARKVGQIVGRGPRTWLVRVYNGRDLETKKRNYLNHTIHGGLRDAQAHLNKMLGERDRGRNLDSSKQTLNQYLDRWLEVCAKPRLRAKSLQDYEGLLRRYVRPQLGMKGLPTVSAFDIQMLYRELLDRSLSARSIRYTHAVLRSALKQAVRWNLILANPADLVDLPRPTSTPALKKAKARGICPTGKPAALSPPAKPSPCRRPKVNATNHGFCCASPSGFPRLRRTS